MKTPVKLAAYLAGLGVVFAAAAGAGVVTGPVAMGDAEHADTATNDTHDAHQPGTAAVAGGLKGLAASQDGYLLEPAAGTLPAGGGTYSFRILDRESRPVTGFTRSHSKDLHLIVVRRDLVGFAHVHPTMAADGTWSVPLKPGAGGGSYRVFADFIPAGHGRGLTLGTDLAVAGKFAPVPLPAPARTSVVDGYSVSLDGDLTPGTSSKLTLTVARDGKPVTDLQPYLGAYGHLVTLRAGDLAYLHVHPDGGPGDGKTAAGPDIGFHAEVPTVGDYRLFLDFQHDGVVRTAEFTTKAVARPPAPTDTTESGGHGHGD